MPNRVRAIAHDGSLAFPPVRVVSGPAFELAAELAAFTSGPARASLDSGKAWIRDVRSLAGHGPLERAVPHHRAVQR